MNLLSFFKGTKLYLSILTLVAFILLLSNITFQPQPSWIVLLLLIGSIILLNHYMIFLAPKGNCLSMDSSIYLATIFLFGLELPLTLLLFSSILITIFFYKKTALWKHLFNMAMYTVMITGAYYTFIFLGGNIGLVNTESLIAYCLALFSYLLINVFLVGMYFVVDSFKSSLSIIKMILKDSLSNYVITLALAIIFTMLLGSYPILGTIVFTFIIVMLSLVFARYFKLYEEVVNDKKTREQILNSLPIGIITYDDKTSEFSLNAPAEGLLKKDNHEVSRIVNSLEEKDSFWQIISSEKSVQNEKIHVKNDDDTKRVLLVSQSALNDSYDHLTGRIIHFIDITEEEEREKRIQQSEKLAVLGSAAARAAHEIRNPLAVIHGFLSLMKQSSEENSKKLQLPLMLKELDRINSIVEDMLMMAKPGVPTLKEAYIEDILNEILPFYRESQGTKNIQFEVNVTRLPLLLDTRQIKQVLYNLIRNSCEAMGERGKLSIYSVVEGNMYLLFIKDNGAGIPENIRERVFEPFLTSKETGTGLGLIIVQRIIENHHGTIELYSSSEKGTTFLISIPLKGLN
ncbi:sensor histidine kinase [Bacillus luteolus]|uniref:histidine kinase n=1 Tax=Litchfieldia luteola TaxID=682179 RepID=A0ABR9QFA1_9BACI|nr:ATP-binding protein [Cytobacillus luteolus]MBE4907170.1 sensor histidine kinase [Cytobacillus luteolus]MBP1943359.1 signal transduction histidine kinase [Cytobacillus luteolus]